MCRILIFCVPHEHEVLNDDAHFCSSLHMKLQAEDFKGVNMGSIEFGGDHAQERVKSKPLCSPFQQLPEVSTHPFLQLQAFRKATTTVTEF